MMLLKMELVFAVLVLACLQSFVLPDSQVSRDALISLRTSLNSSPNQLKDWIPTQISPCTWSNVNCDPNHNVVSVILSNIGFSGILSPKLGALKNLQNLSLQGNGIAGEIPKEFGNLTSLSILSLQNNNLTGEIPASLGNLKSLQFLTLNNNNLSGTIPVTFKSYKLDYQLSSNALTGQIPEQLFCVKTYDFTGNHLKCGMNLLHHCATDIYGSGAKSKLKLGIIVGVVVGLVILLLLGGLLYLTYKRRHKGFKREVFEDVAGDRRIAFGQLKDFHGGNCS